MVRRSGIVLGAVALLGVALLAYVTRSPVAQPSPAASPPAVRPPAASSPASSPPAPSGTPRTSPGASTEANLFPPPGVEGETEEGTLFVQLQVKADSVQVLHVETRPGLPYRFRATAGRFGLLIEGRDGARASLRFDVALSGAGQDEVWGDELRVAAAPVLLKLPRVGLPARLRVLSPTGTVIGDLELRE